MNKKAALFVLIIFLLTAFVPSFRAKAESLPQSDDNKVCYKPDDQTMILQVCFDRDAFIPLPVSIFRADEQNRLSALASVTLHYVIDYLDSAYTTPITCVTSSQGTCTLLVPGNSAGSVVIDASDARSLNVDPIGYEDVYNKQALAVEKAYAEGDIIEDPFAGPLPYIVTAKNGEKIMMVVARSGDGEKYASHWVMYTQQTAGSPFVRTDMGKYTPSASVLPDKLVGGDSLAQIDSPTPTAARLTTTAAAPSQGDQGEIPVWVFVMCGLLLVGVLLLALRLRLILGAK